jgi:hypothetical protein
MNLQELPHHHALLITHSDRKSTANSLWKELEILSPAHRYFDVTVLDIDTARTIISWAKSSYDSDRVGLISFHTIGVPAQNALLKILEEPNEKTRFILVTSNKENLIETVLSRVLHHDSNLHTAKKSSPEVLEFISTSPTQRMKLSSVTALLSKTDEEDRKDREAVRAFILSLAEYFSTKKDCVRYVPEILEVASFASDPSSSGKALLEYLSLLLPQVKD